MSANLIIIQARLSSTRLPGKVLMPFDENQCLLDLQLNKIKALGVPFVLAITTNPSDDALVTWAEVHKVKVFRGSENDVLDRFVACAKAFNAKHLIRVCSDNPFVQLDEVNHYLNQLSTGTDYISFCNSQQVPAIKTHWGLYVEGVRLSALTKAQELLQGHPDKKFYSEHVTNFIYGHPEQFQVKLMEAPEIVKDRNDLRFTIDTPEDFENMQRMYQTIEKEGGDFSLESLVKTSDAYPEIKEVMGEGIARFSK